MGAHSGTARFQENAMLNATPATTPVKTTPNPFRIEDFATEGKQIICKHRESGEDKKMTVLTDLSVFKGKFGTFLSSGKAEGDKVQYAINVKKELKGPIGKYPVAYLTVRKAGDEKGTVLCNLFLQSSLTTGEKYLKGSNRETGEAYYVYANTPKEPQKS